MMFAEQVVGLQDEAVWVIRNLVRKTEVLSMTNTWINPNYRHLHDVTRHAIHVSETIGLAVTTVNDIITKHKQFIADRSFICEDAKTAGNKIHSRFKFYASALSGLQSRSISNKKRLLNEVRLSFNLVAQRDSSASVKISRDVQSDSAAMRTIAFATLTFFPATFISSIFSMSFFSFDTEDDKWRVSESFWVYWVVVIPITCITLALWFYWSRSPPKSQVTTDEFCNGAKRLTRIEASP